MIPLSPYRTSPIHHTSNTLFAWRGGRILLLGEREADKWVVARAWPNQDRLTDVRRWIFPTSHQFACQITRLVREAVGDEDLAQTAGSAARAWASACQSA